MERKQTNNLQKNVHRNPKLNIAKTFHKQPSSNIFKSIESIATHDTKTTKVWHTSSNEHSKD